MPTYPSDQLVDGYRRLPIEDHGKLRFQSFSVAALTVAYLANDQIDLCRLPSGRKRILPQLCRIRTSAFGAGRTLSIGHRAYMKRPPSEPIYLEAESNNALLSALDVSAIVLGAAWTTTTLKYDMYSLDEITLHATIAGGTMPVSATMEGFVAYLYE